MENRCRSAVALLVLLLQGAALHAAAAPVFTAVDRQGDPLPQGALARLGPIRLRHGLTVGSGHCQVIFSPDGRVLLSRGETGIQAWDVETGRPLDWVPQRHGPLAAQLLPDGQTLVIANVERSRARGKFETNWVVERRRWGTGALLGSVAFPAASEQVRLALLSRDGKVLVGWGYGEKLTLWNAQTGRKLCQIDRTVSLGWPALTPDGKQLVLPAKAAAHLYDTRTGKLVRALIPEGPRSTSPDPIYGLPEVSPDGRLLVLSSNRDLHFWDLRTGKRLARCPGVRGRVCFTADGRWLACATRRAIHLLEARSLKVVRVFEPHHEMSGSYALAFSPDGKRLALGGAYAITLWDVTTGKRLAHPAGHLSIVYSLAFSSDGKRLASGGQDGTALVWDLATSRALHTFHGHYLSVVGLAFSPDGRRLATGDGQPNYGNDGREALVRLYDLDTGKLVRQFHGHLNGVHALRFSPDGTKLATGGGDDRVRLWDVATGRRLGQVRHLRMSRPVSFLAGGKSLLIYQEDGSCRVVEATSLRSLAAFGGGQRSFASTAGCLPGEKEAVVVTFREAVWYDLAKGEATRRRKLSAGWSGNAGALSPSATVLAYAGPGRWEVGLWDLLSGKRFAILKGHTSFITALAFSPDGRRLASASFDTTVLIWDVERLWVEHVLSELMAGRGDVRLLAADPKPVIATLVARLRQSAQSERMARRLIQGLDDDDFAVREKATAALEKLGLGVAFALQRAAEDGASPEVRVRARRLLAKFDAKDLQKVLSPDRARMAVELLVGLGGPASRRALEELAELDRHTLVGQEARRALAGARGKGPKR
jgi:WD40 repeat protein